MRGTEQRGQCSDPSAMSWPSGPSFNLTCRNMDSNWLKLSSQIKGVGRWVILHGYSCRKEIEFPYNRLPSTHTPRQITHNDTQKGICLKVIATTPWRLRARQSPPGRVACYFTSIGMMNLLHNVNHCLIVSLIALPLSARSQLPQPLEEQGNYKELSMCTSGKEILPIGKQSGLVDKGVESPSGVAQSESH